MSCFIVEDKTINSIVSFMYHHAIDNRSHLYSIRCPLDGQKETIISTSSRLNVNSYKSLAKQMFEMNVKAYDIRYPFEASEDTSDEYVFEIIKLEKLDVFQIIKSLDCFLYQCSEGNIPDSNLYELRNEWLQNVCVNVVRSLPQYEQATWQ